MGLCHRCEYRAQFKEAGHAPRMECGSNGSTCGCYMYKPVLPAVLTPNNGDKRPRFAGAMFSARERFVRVASRSELRLKVEKFKDGCVLVYYKPSQAEIAAENKRAREHEKRMKALAKKLKK